MRRAAVADAVAEAGGAQEARGGAAAWEGGRGREGGATAGGGVAAWCVQCRGGVPAARAAARVGPRWGRGRASPPASSSRALRDGVRTVEAASGSLLELFFPVATAAPDASLPCGCLCACPGQRPPHSAAPLRRLAAWHPAASPLGVSGAKATRDAVRQRPSQTGRVGCTAPTRLAPLLLCFWGAAGCPRLQAAPDHVAVWRGQTGCSPRSGVESPCRVVLLRAPA